MPVLKNNLNARVNGLGDIRYSRNPIQSTQKLQGSGSIK